MREIRACGRERESAVVLSSSMRSIVRAAAGTRTNNRSDRRKNFTVSRSLEVLPLRLERPITIMTNAPFQKHDTVLAPYSNRGYFRARIEKIVDHGGPGSATSTSTTTTNTSATSDATTSTTNVLSTTATSSTPASVPVGATGAVVADDVAQIIWLRPTALDAIQGVSEESFLISTGEDETLQLEHRVTDLKPLEAGKGNHEGGGAGGSG